MIDDTRIKEMRDTFGDAEFAELIELFREEAAEIVGSLQHRMGAELGASLHALRGSAENMGLQDLSARCRLGEKVLSEGGDVDPSAICEAFDSGVRALLDRMDLPPAR